MDREKFLNALLFVQRGISKREVVAQSSSIVFHDGVIYTYNDEIGIQYPLREKEFENINGAVNATELTNLIKKMTVDNITVESSCHSLRLKAGRIKAEFVLEEEVKLPYEEMLYTGEWKKFPKDFTKAINFVLPACSTDMAKPLLTCAHVNAKKGRLEASDGYRVATYKLEDEWPFGSVLIPHYSVKYTAPFQDDFTRVGVSENWIHFRTKYGAVFSCRIFGTEDIFPNISNLITLKKGITVVCSKHAVAAVERADVFSSSVKDKISIPEITIEITDDRMWVTGKSPTGRYTENVPIETKEKCDRIKFQVNPMMFKALISQYPKCKIGDSFILFSGENWTYTVALQIDGE